MRAHKARGPFQDLAAFLAATGVTQQALARAVHASQATIARIAQGAVVPQPKLAAKLARYCNIPLDSFTRCYLAAHAESTEAR